MKMRLSHVTNSSSSSFIIDKNQVSKEKLKEILTEMATLDAGEWDNEFEEAWKYFDYNDEGYYRYHVREATEENPLNDNGVKWDKYSTGTQYTHHWIVDNDDCGRYDWGTIEDVLYKHNVDWHRGYCD